jgi:acyl-CoA synthetase (AMP-forming)/AMP-acid ligase II
MTQDTIAGLIAGLPADRPAIGAPDRSALTYGGLDDLIRRTGDWLRRHGIGQSTRVAIVLPNGPEAASCFIAVAASAVAAPLNPASKAPEFEFDYRDLGIRVVIVADGADTPAVAVAGELGVAVIRLVPGEAAGDFTLSLDRPDDPAESATAEPGDLALLLHTSGTTSRPKIVPLSHRNVTSSARQIAATLALGPADRGLVIMPLFHIHGLIAGVLAPLAAGSFIYCPPGFDALRFFQWMDQAKATWYTAVPTMHQTILLRAARNKAVIERNPLRFMRSSSASMPMAVIEELEAVFGAPLIESYGMSEASHQMASNPLPPAPRKIGSVGIAAGPEVEIMGEDGSLLSPGEVGEIVIRGPGVTAGYENNPAANATAFTDGWFRTGDQGVKDEEGYLRLTGRLKEIINRGGEKVAPREVDEVLMEHPAIGQAVCFAVPHAKLGEDVAAAIVLRDGASATDRDIQQFCAERLAGFKVPKTVVFVAEIPKGPTGKLQRIGLAKALGLG